MDTQESRRWLVAEIARRGTVRLSVLVATAGKQKRGWSQERLADDVAALVMAGLCSLQPCRNEALAVGYDALITFISPPDPVSPTPSPKATRSIPTPLMGRPKVQTDPEPEEQLTIQQRRWRNGEDLGGKMEPSR